MFDLGPGNRRIPADLSISISGTIGRAPDRYLYPPREVQTVLATRDLDGWDVLFVEHVARDGILLWARGPLPDAMAPVAARAALASSGSGA